MSASDLAAFESLLGEAVRDVTTDAAVIRTCSRKRVSCEGWLKAELLTRLDRQANCQVSPELDYVDLTVQLGAVTYLLELKTFPTNYGGAGKPITNFIGSVVGDLAKLRARSAPAQHGYALWMAYPIPDRRLSVWDTHLGRIVAASTSTVLIHSLELEAGASAHFYLSRC